MNKCKISINVEDGCMEFVIEMVESMIANPLYSDNIVFELVDLGVSSENKTKIEQLIDNNIAVIKHEKDAFGESLVKTPQEKELFSKIIKINSDNMRNFFEESVKSQINSLGKHYEAISVEQKLFYDKKLSEQSLVQDEVYRAKLSEQKAFYEKELQDFKCSFSINMNSELDNSARWYLENIKQELDAQSLLYENKINELIEKNRELEEQIVLLNNKD